MAMKRIISLLLAVIILFALSACSDTTAVSPTPTVSATAADDAYVSPTPHSTGEIYLYGVTYEDKITFDREFEVWKDHYENDNMRHLFNGFPYYSMEYLNEWMHSNDDEILDVLFKHLKDDDYNNMTEFYKKIKSECPDTVFHGIGVNYSERGEKYLKHLEDTYMAGLENYKLTQEANEQGKTFYNDGTYDWAYRENTMAENFTREFDKLNGESVMGIFGVDLANIDAIDSHTHSVQSMAGQLYAVYGDAVHSEDIRNTKPIRSDIITVGTKEYEALYFGKIDLGGDTYISMEFWRLEDAYNDLRYSRKTDIKIDDSYYPMQIEEGQVFIIDWNKIDGTTERTYYLYDGFVWNGMKITKEFTVN